MIRPFTVLTMAMAMASGAYLFGVKHRAQVLDDQLASVAQASRLDQQRIRVLQAQWALEIDPHRLTQLAAQFSQLQPMKAAQLVTLAALPGILPDAGAAAPGENPAAPAMPQIAQAAAPDVTADDRVAMLPMPPPEAPDAAPADLVAVPAPRHQVPSPAALRAMLGAKIPAARVASVARRQAPSRLAHSELAENLPPPRPLYTQNAADNAPMGARVMSVSAMPMNTDAQGGSMLGMAADLAPPQPVAQGTGN
jgi:hypothetical protein